MPKVILIADEGRVLRRAVESLFVEQMDYKVMAVSDGEEAILKTKIIKPDVVVIVASLPKKDGYQVTRKIKSDPELKGIPVLLISGRSEPIDQKRAQEVGVDDYIIRPFESIEIAEKVRSFMDRVRVDSDEEEDVVLLEEVIEF